MIRTMMVERLSPFRRWLPTDVYVWMKAVLLALVAIQAARLLWAIVTPVGPFGPWQPSSARVLPPQAQSALIASVDPFFRASGPSAADAAIQVDLQLFGVRESQGAIPGSAILGTADGEQKSYLVGEEVAPGVALAEVHFDHVVLSRGAARQTLHMPTADQGDAPAGQPSGSAPSAPAVTASAAAQALSLTPRHQGGRVTGVQVASGPNAALFAATGLRAGDVIVAVNGARITSITDVQQLQSSIAPGARLMLTVERGAQAIPIALNLPGNS